MPLPQPLPDLSSLDLLVSVKKEGSISKAASLHHISQPAASMKIRLLENTLGLSLLERTPAGAKLTEAGVLISSVVEEITEKIYELKELADLLQESRHSELKIAASMTVAEYLVPNWIHKLRLRCENQKRELPFVKLVIKNSRDVVEEIRSKSAEIGFIENNIEPSGLESKVVFEDELVIIAAPSHPLSKRGKPISLELLGNINICSREEGSGTREVLETMLEERNIPVRNIIELASTTAIKTAVESGVGLGVLSKLAVKSEVELGTLQIIAVKDLELTRKVHAIWQNTKQVSYLAQEFLKVCMQS